MQKTDVDGSSRTRELIRFVLRGALPALAVAAVAAVSVYLWAQRQPRTFAAEAIVLVSRGTGNAFDLAAARAPPIDLAAHRFAATSDTALSDALRLLGHEAPTLDAVRDLRERLSLRAEAGTRDSSLLRIEARGASAAEAAERANAVALALVAWDERRAREVLDRVVAALERQIEALSEQIRVLQALGAGVDDARITSIARLRSERQQQLAYARALVTSAQGLTSVLQPADTTARRVAPRPRVTAAIAALVAVVAAYALLLLRTGLDTRLAGPDDLAAVAGRPVLAVFPVSAGPADLRLREAASYLRANLHFGSREVDQRVVMVTSSVDGEGKTFTATALAESFARYGHRTLLIDADLRAPSVIERFEVIGGIGAAATTEHWLESPDVEHQLLSVLVGHDGQLDVIPQLDVVDRASELLGRRLRSALQSVADYEVVIIDTPPLLAVADALAIAPHCTGVLLVVDRDRTTRRVLTAAIAALRQIGVTDVGLIANRIGGAGGRFDEDARRYRGSARRAAPLGQTR